MAGGLQSQLILDIACHPVDRVASGVLSPRRGGGSCEPRALILLYQKVPWFIRALGSIGLIDN